MTRDPFGLVGQVLDGQFRVDRVVGEGGFSVVYHAHHVGLDEPVAVKCLKLQPGLDPAIATSFELRFHDESRIHYRLSSGSLHVARAIAAGAFTAPATGARVPYMVLEWLEGHTLAEELRARRERGERGRPLADVVRLLDPVAEAIAFAHAQGIVHRDLNPSNLFVASAGGATRLKLLDFGVAKIVSDHVLARTRGATVGGVRTFTPGYGAPEQIDDTLGPIAPHTDVFAFALVVLELATDRPPVPGDSPVEMGMRALDPHRRPTPRALGLLVGDAVEAVFARALSLDPTMRPRDVGELWGMLKNAMGRDGERRPLPFVPDLASASTSPLQEAVNPLGATSPPESDLTARGPTPSESAPTSPAPAVHPRGAGGTVPLLPAYAPPPAGMGAAAPAVDGAVAPHLRPNRGTVPLRATTARAVDLGSTTPEAGAQAPSFMPPAPGVAPGRGVATTQPDLLAVPAAPVVPPRAPDAELDAVVPMTRSLAPWIAGALVALGLVGALGWVVWRTLAR